jgi:hypothetical protein
MKETGEDERRRYPRISDATRLSWRKIDQTEFFPRGADGITQNISGGGICFRTPAMLQTGDMLALHLGLSEFPAPILALGKVVRSSAVEEGEHEIAAEFWWIGWDDDTAQRAIGDYIRTKLG